MSSIIRRSSVALVWIVSQYSFWVAVSCVSSRNTLHAMTALKGVRISWLIFAKTDIRVILNGSTCAFHQSCCFGRLFCFLHASVHLRLFNCDSRVSAKEFQYFESFRRKSLCYMEVFEIQHCYKNISKVDKPPSLDIGMHNIDAGFLFRKYGSLP